MALVTFIDFEGEAREIEATSGDTLMEAAINNDVPGIDADCGGACACATCHVYIDEKWLAAAGQPGELEREMLEVAENVKSNSRLACQIVINEDVDGIVVTTPESQY